MYDDSDAGDYVRASECDEGDVGDDEGEMSSDSGVSDSCTNGEPPRQKLKKAGSGSADTF